MRTILPLLACLAISSSAFAQADTALQRVQALSPIDMDEVIWLARAVYSESDRADEQRLVAWVIRNRVETGFRGDSYREVVLEPMQFSAFNTPSPRREYILGLDQQDEVPSWLQALDAALEVYRARPTARPFSIDTRHFYSPVSMVGRDEPTWASAGTELSSLALNVDPNRFRFISGIDQGLDLPSTLLGPGAAIDPSATTAEALLGGSSLVKSRIDQQWVDQQVRAAERKTTVQMPGRTRKFSGKIRRPARPATRVNSGG